MSDDAAPDADPSPRATTAPHNEAADPETPVASHRQRLIYRIAFCLIMILVLVTVVAFPIALRSMVNTVFIGRGDIVFDLKTGASLSDSVLTEDEADRTYLNVGVVNIDEGAAAASLVVSGHRECAGNCPNLDLYLVSVADDAGRQGMSPAAQLDLIESSSVVTQTITLPVAGKPSLYPFDRYTLQLAIAGYAVDAAGTPTPLTPATFNNELVATIQDQVAEFIMQPPTPIVVSEAQRDSSPLDGLAGQSLLFERPAYIQMLTIMLITLIGISGGLALLTRSIDDLLLGVGGLILGVWGVRSVIMPQPLPTLSLVEVALSSEILIILTGLSIRTAVYFYYQRAGFKLRRPRLD